MALDPAALRTLAYAGIVLLAVLAIRLRGTTAVWKARFPLRFRPPAPVDLGSVPGVDPAYLAKGAGKLKDLGFRHLLDYELPAGSARLRHLYSSYLSRDGKTVASLVQRFAKSFAHDYVVFSSWFASGHRVATSSSPIVAPEINPTIHAVPMPDCEDLRALARRHEAEAARWTAKGHERVVLSGMEDLRRLLMEGREREVRSLAEAGYVRIDGEEARATGKMAWALLLHGFSPVRRGVSLEAHLWWILGPAALAGIGLSYLLRSHAAPARDLCLMAGAGLGISFGYGLWHHALVWSVLLPAALVGGLTGSVEFSGLAVAAALAMGQIGFQLGAARSRARGRRAVDAKGPEA